MREQSGHVTLWSAAQLQTATQHDALRDLQA